MRKFYYIVKFKTAGINNERVFLKTVAKRKTWWGAKMACIVLNRAKEGSQYYYEAVIGFGDIGYFKK